MQNLRHIPVPFRLKNERALCVLVFCCCQMRPCQVYYHTKMDMFVFDMLIGGCCRQLSSSDEQSRPLDWKLTWVLCCFQEILNTLPFK